jgi:hypothetical protein
MSDEELDSLEALVDRFLSTVRQEGKKEAYPFARRIVNQILHPIDVREVFTDKPGHYMFGVS